MQKFTEKFLLEKFDIPGTFVVLYGYSDRLFLAIYLRQRER